MTVITEDGQTLRPPAGWTLLPPGDAALTRRVKASGPTWTVQEKKGRKTFSRGVWADAGRIASIRESLLAERSTETYAKRLEADRGRRERKQQEYVGSFESAVLQFLNFSPQHAELAEKLAAAVTRHATPVGSGTVARTTRIPIERRAESAVIAWMRHQTTAYDSLKIARIKGKRREVRQTLAAESRRLLDAYRKNRGVDPEQCPLQRALRQPPE
ncbi:DUF2293 domain-containing protein [Candidatus Laterigemmans baculatus]|uniref:DUF2293 domain-containing protein n=1 Tax=Candidatus Laterigemmans baculatus TaxID=2770505 RepID=UPI00193B113A|nr:DUF2293 domain-containing protein [Candidatus Laterigemmans baculatus]